MQETKKGKINLLVDTDATIILIKIGKIKGERKIRDERMALVGATGHKIHTLDKIRANKFKRSQNKIYRTPCEGQFLEGIRGNPRN